MIFSRAEMSPYIFWEILPKATGPFGQFVAIVATTGDGLVTESPLKKKTLLSSSLHIKHSQPHYCP